MFTLMQGREDDVFKAFNSLRTAFAVFDSEDVLVYHNTQLHYVFHAFQDESQLLGKRFEDLARIKLDNGEIAGELAVADPDRWLSWRLEQHRSSHNTIELRLTDGRWIEVKERRTPEGITVTQWADTTVCKGQELRLDEVIESIEASPIATGVTDFNCRILRGNQLFLQLGQWQQDQGGSPKLRLVFENAARYQEYLNKVRAGNVIRNEEAELILADGTSVWVSVSMQLWVFERQHSALTWLYDVTDLKEKSEALRRARKDAEHANKSKSEFLANMSHEIRTPMNAVIGMNYLLQQTALDKSQREYVDKANNAARSLLTIINDILDFSKIEAGKIELENTDFKLSDVLKRLADVVNGVVSKKDIEFCIVAPPDIPDFLVGDPTRLGQILINLANNAVKFTEEGSVVVDISAVEVTDGTVTLDMAIRDTGIGMSQDQMNKLFKAFSQADSSTTRMFGGTGLGLTISKQLAEKMGGDISVDSEPDVGSVFTARVRLQRVAGRQDTIAGPVERLSGKRALVIEGFETERDSIRVLLDAWGLEVVTSDSEDDALALLKDQGGSFDFILADWKTPGKGGADLIRSIREIESASPIILMVTPFSQDQAHEETDLLDLQGFIVKPITMVELFDAITGILDGEDHKDATLDEEAQPKDRLIGRRLLLAEDNEINQQIAMAIFTGEGARMEVVANGAACLSMVEDDEEGFDLVLMDLHMPVMDGREATRRIRATKTPDELPILAMTASAMEHERQECLALGMNDHISKPIDVDLAIETMHRWMKPLGGGETAETQPKEPSAMADAKDALANKPGEPDFSKIPGFDEAAALKRVAGNADLLKKLMLSFADSNADSASRLRTLLDAKDYENAFGLVHQVKGAAGNLAATGLYTAAKDFQSAFETKDEASYESHFTAFSNQMSDLLAALGRKSSAVEAKAAPPPAPAAAASSGASMDDVLRQEVLEHCQGLIELMEARNMRAVKMVGTVKERLEGNGFDDELQAFETALMSLDFTAGCAATQALIDRIEKGG